VAIVHVRRNTIFPCLNDEHCSVVSPIPHDYCLLTHRGLSRQRLVVQWRIGVFDLLSDLSRYVLLVNGLWLNAVVINLLPLGQATVSAWHWGEGRCEWPQVSSLRNLDDLGVLSVLALGGSTFLVISLVYKRDDVAAVVTFGPVFFISKRVIVVPVN